MKKYLLASVFSIIAATSAISASQQFYNVDVRPGPYYVYGVTANAEKNDNPACYAEVNWRDGSRFQLIRDLNDGELYIYLQANMWAITDAPGIYQLRANFTSSNGRLNGINYQYQLVNKNTIVIRNIRKEDFIPLFSTNKLMTFVMPGTIQNTEVDLTGSLAALAEISKCIEASKSVDLYPQGSNNTQNNSKSFTNI
jgi:hypothetical protein